MLVGSEMTDSVDRRLVYLDPNRVDQALLKAGLSRKAFAAKAAVSFNTMRAALNRRGVHRHTAHVIAKALGCDVMELLAPCDPCYVAPKELPGPWSIASEWEAEECLEPGRRASNGLCYIVHRMRHRHTAGRRGRGKYYHFSLMPDARKKDLLHQLSRHADVCERVKRHPHLASNLTSTPVASNEGWWVIDEWVGERTLADHLRSGLWPKERIPRVLHETALGLGALHTSGIIFRELAPSRVLISDSDGRSVLTDFELAKLLDGSPSVSSDWPEDPFRAPEVDGGSTTVQADLYSFGKLALTSVGANINDLDGAPLALGLAGVPKRLARVLLDCMEPIPADRPKELAPVLKELGRWVRK
jgi:serine/threonine protein kinase